MKKSWLGFYEHCTIVNQDDPDVCIFTEMAEYLVPSSEFWDAAKYLAARAATRIAVIDIFELSCEIPKNHWAATNLLPCSTELRERLIGEGSNASHYSGGSSEYDDFDTEPGFRYAFLRYVRLNHEILDKKFPLHNLT